MMELDQIEGIRAPGFRSPHFKEFIVNFDGTGKTVTEVNKALLAQRIFGGKDLSHEFPELGQSALYCVTEVHTQADLDTLAGALRKVVEA
jgi:glycine dehydrogenase subunit 1